MNTKTTATLFFVGTLLVGMAAGVFIDRVLLRHELPFMAPREFGERPRMHLFARHLELTPEQEEKLATILEEYQKKFRKLRMEPQHRALRDSLQTEIRALLTPEQQEKFEAMQPPFEKWRGPGHRHPPGPPPPEQPEHF